MHRAGFTIAFVIAASALGQANFELQGPPCTYTFPVPCGGTGDPEGVSKAASSFIANSIATVDQPNAAGMPCSGFKYARVIATGPLSVPLGGPMPGLPILGSKLYIPIPPGAATVNLCWDFYLVDNPPQAAYNDGMSIDFIGSCSGSTISNLAYADAFTPSSGVATDTGSPCASGGWDVLPAAVPQFVVSAPIPAGAAWIRVVVWNGGDDFASSHGVIDDVNFVSLPQCALVFSSPAGVGSVQMQNTVCPASVGLSYFTPVDLTPGTFPFGWFFGLDVSLPELVSVFNLGFPFRGPFNSQGASSSGAFGPAPGLSGLTLYAVTTEWTAGYAALVAVRAPASYTIP